MNFKHRIKTQTTHKNTNKYRHVHWMSLKHRRKTKHKHKNKHKQIQEWILNVFKGLQKNKTKHKHKHKTQTNTGIGIEWVSSTAEKQTQTNTGMGIKWISSVGEKQTHFDLLLLFALHYCQRGIKKYINPMYMDANISFDTMPNNSHSYDNHRYYRNWVRAIQWNLITRVQSVPDGPFVSHVINNSPQPVYWHWKSVHNIEEKVSDEGFFKSISGLPACHQFSRMILAGRVKNEAKWVYQKGVRCRTAHRAAHQHVA